MCYYCVQFLCSDSKIILDVVLSAIVGCNYCMQHAAIIWNVCNYCSVLSEIIAHETRAHRVFVAELVQLILAVERGEES